jgi:hypothetical protein
MGHSQETSPRGRQIRPDGAGTMISTIKTGARDVYDSWRRSQRSAREGVVVGVKHPNRYAANRRTRATEWPMLLLQCTRDHREPARPARAGEVAGLRLREPTFAAGIRNSKSCTECRWKVSALWLGNSVSPLTQGVKWGAARSNTKFGARWAGAPEVCARRRRLLSNPLNSWRKAKSRVGGRRPSEPGDFALDLKLKRRKSNRDSVGPC